MCCLNLDNVFHYRLSSLMREKKFTRWDVGRAWGLCLYQTGFDNGFWSELKLQLGPLYLAPKVALGPNQVIAPEPSSQRTTPKPPKISI